MEKKVQQAAAAVRRELKHPLMPAGAKAALIGLAAAVEMLAHEVEILKLSADSMAAANARQIVRAA